MSVAGALADQVVAGVGDLLDLVDDVLLGADVVEIGPVAHRRAGHAGHGSLQVGRDAGQQDAHDARPLNDCVSETGRRPARPGWAQAGGKRAN